ITNYVDSKVHGLLQTFEMACNNKNVGFYIQAYGLNNTVFCNLRATYADLLAGGYGLTPGEVAPLPNGTSPDPMGRIVPNVPHLLRYKDTTNPDALGSTSKMFSMVFSPIPPLEYLTRLHIILFN